MSVNGAPGKGPQGDLTPEERAALEERSNDLGRKLREARQTEHGQRPEAKSRTGRSEAMGRAMKLSSELVGGVVVGGAIGWYLDSWLQTKPWLFILFFLIGTAAGMRNLVVGAMQQKTPSTPPSSGGADKDK
jgi:ATP synthase protein I